MRTVVVTGASSGLGREIALELAKQSAKLILVARNTDRLQEVGRECLLYGAYSVNCLELDLANQTSIKTTAKWISNHFSAIDLLINNAGIGFFEDFVDQSVEEIKSTLDVNVLGTMLFTKGLVLSIENVAGNILNICSVAASVTTKKAAVYGASKAALVAWSNGLRLELKNKNVGVKVVNPGPMKTNFFDNADKTGRYLEKMGSLALDPNITAKKIIRLSQSNQTELFLPVYMGWSSKLYKVFPRIGNKVLESKLIDRK
ncbi:SDR family NAD(P)-dependent oxidoreductase [Pediococcus argentinicus]|uniref:SDR family NAD(P)-dependent oxidoreductase n=1 Tax=Pediococcus argentinicus TaxID=480391 RepID=UPI00338FC1E1